MTEQRLLTIWRLALVAIALIGLAGLVFGGPR